MNVKTWLKWVCPLAFLRLEFGGGSKSSSTQETNFYDKRNAVQDGIGISGDSNALQITNTTSITDSGIVSRGLETVDNTVSSALDAITINNATNAEGFSKLIDAGNQLFDRSESLIGQTQKAVADAYGQAQADKAGSIDNRTLIALAAAGVVAAFAFRK